MMLRSVRSPRRPLPGPQVVGGNRLSGAGVGTPVCPVPTSLVCGRRNDGKERNDG